MSPTRSGPIRTVIGHNGVMLKGWLGLTVFVLLSLVGCAPKKFLIGGQEPKNPIRTIVSLSPSTTEIVAAMQLQDKLVGKTSSCDYPLGLNTVPIVVSGTKPDFEKIAGIRPDLIVYDEKLYANTDLSKLKSLLPQAEVMPLNADTVEKLTDYVYQVGGRCGAASFASKLADDIYAAVGNAEAGQATAKPRVAVFTGGGGNYYVAGTESFLADVVKISGGIPVGPTGDVFAPMAIEALVKADPEIIIVAEKGAQVLADPRLASVSALRVKPTPRVYEVEPGVLLRTGPRVKGLIESLSNLVQQAGRAKEGQG